MIESFFFFNFRFNFCFFFVVVVVYSLWCSISTWAQYKVSLQMSIFIHLQFGPNGPGIINSTQTTNCKTNFIRRFPFSRSFVRVGWKFLVNASLNRSRDVFQWQGYKWDCCSEVFVNHLRYSCAMQAVPLCYTLYMILFGNTKFWVPQKQNNLFRT